MNLKQSKIVILLSTYNGAKYLKNQIDSLTSQSYNGFRIIARDDRSSDESLLILKSYDKIEIVDSQQNLGAKGSFAELLEYAVKHTDGEFFMFCDQDDVWKNDKVEKTLAKMQEMEKNFEDTPLLVHTDLEVVDERLNSINSSFMDFQKIDAMKNKLHNLFIQNTITGCTVMINRDLAKRCLPIPDEAIMHDWWLGLVASYFGKIAYINESTIKYRQHGSNTIGAKGFSYLNIAKKGFSVFLNRNHLNVNITQAKIFLDRYRDKLDNNTIEMLEDFSTIESKSFWQRRKILLRHKLLKQGLIRNIGLLAKI